MIRSMVSKMIRSMITTVINPFDGLISRYFITLDPVLQSHYEMIAPITFAGDFEIEVEFSTTNTSNQILIADSHSASYYFRTEGSTGFGVFVAGASFVFTSSININNGKLHKVKFKLVGNSLSCILDGSLLGSQTITPYTGANNFIIGRSNSSALYFDGIIANAKFTDKSGASDVVTTFKLDNSPAAENYTYSTELLDNNTFPDNANARQYLVATKGWIITDGGAA